jgi:hypothetical protein
MIDNDSREQMEKNKKKKEIKLSKLLAKQNKII